MAMRNQITFRQYRGMDLIFFTALLCLCESLIALAANQWFPKEPYTLSLTAAVTALVMIRWGAFAILPALAGGLAVCLASRAAPIQYLIYCLGNLAGLGMLFFIKKITWQKIREDVLLSMLYGFLTCLAMQLGRMAVALATGHDPLACLGFITTDVLSLLFSVLILGIARRLDGMLEDQKHYLFRIQREKEQNKGA